VQLLRQMGAEVRVADPHVVEAVHGAPDLTMVTLTAEELRSADAVVLLTDHDEFDYDLIASEARCLLDTRRRLHGPAIEVI
jgi:UDP-N-acetyl-D-glucosamine dehydrogenase